MDKNAIEAFYEILCDIRNDLLRIAEAIENING